MLLSEEVSTAKCLDALSIFYSPAPQWHVITAEQIPPSSFWLPIILPPSVEYESHFLNVPSSSHCRLPILEWFGDPCTSRFLQ